MIALARLANGSRVGVIVGVPWRAWSGANRGSAAHRWSTAAATS
jgi:hypothetical protein